MSANKDSYLKELLQKVDLAILFTKYRILHRLYDEQLAVVLDIDNTALVNFGWMDSYFNYNSRVRNRKNYLYAVPPILRLYYYFLKNNIKVFFVTARSYSTENYLLTKDNLKTAGFWKFVDIFMFGDQRIREKYFQGKIPDSQLTYCVTKRTDPILDEYKISVDRCENEHTRSGKPDILRTCKRDIRDNAITKFKTIVRQCIVDRGYSIILNMGDRDVDLLNGLAEYSIKVPNFRTHDEEKERENKFSRCIESKLEPISSTYNRDRSSCMSQYQQLYPERLSQCVRTAENMATAKVKQYVRQCQNIIKKT